MIATVLVACFAAATAGVPPATPTPSVEETTRWMSETVSEHGTCVLTRIEGDAVFKVTAFVVDRCEFRVESKLLFTRRGELQFDWEIPLQAIDINQIGAWEVERMHQCYTPSISGGSFLYSAKAISASGKITYQRQERDTDLLGTSLGIKHPALAFDDLTIAERFLDAFKHAVRLCEGATPRPKREPF